MVFKETQQHPPRDREASLAADLCSVKVWHRTRTLNNKAMPVQNSSFTTRSKDAVLYFKVLK